MTRPAVAIVDARPASFTASPAIAFRMRINVAEGRVHAMVMRCQIQIDARHRRYDADTRARLVELFGDDTQFMRLLRPVTWSHVALVVPTFEREIVCDLDAPCTYDLDLAAAKYLYAVRDDDIPLTFLCSGTIFRSNEGRVTVEPIPWDVEAQFRMPARVWQDTMTGHFPDGGYIRLQRDTIDRLQAYRGRHALLSWDATVAALLGSAAPDSIV